MPYGPPPKTESAQFRWKEPFEEITATTCSGFVRAKNSKDYSCYDASSTKCERMLHEIVLDALLSQGTSPYGIQRKAKLPVTES